jgi:uncharacterized protein YxeA
MQVVYTDFKSNNIPTMQPNGTSNTNPTPLPKKRINFIYIILILAILCLIGAAVFIIRQKNNDIALLKKELLNSQAQTKKEQEKIKNLAFAVHPEVEYEAFRKSAYVELFNKIFNSKLNDNKVVLVRVFNANAFRRSDVLFKDIQNNDIVLFENKTPGYVGTTRVAIIRPREQKTINSGNIEAYLIDQGRTGNVSSSPLGVKPLNFYSEE